ncbi:MAG: hypothetical protein AB7I59_22595 [Geminicoccaceae bacterium]
MLRPAERFSVNVVHQDEYIGPQPPIFRPSALTLVTFAAILGIGMGGLLPAAWGPAPYRAAPSLADVESGLALIEPAAGPAGGLAVPRAADRAFYAPVLLDGIAVTMRLGPESPGSVLAGRDARLLAAAQAGSAEVAIQRMHLGGLTAGPLTLPVVDAEVSVLGADLLQRFGSVRVDDRQLTLGAR